MSSVPVAWVLGIASATGQVQQIIQTIQRAIQGGPNAPSPFILVGVAVGVALLLGLGILASRRFVGSAQHPSTNAMKGAPETEANSGVLNRLLSRLLGSFGSIPGAGTSARTDPANVNLEEIDDETFDRAVSILEQEGRETSRANIREQVARLIDFEAADPDEFRLGLIQDADSQAQIDQASVAPPSIVPEDPTTLYRNGEFVRILTPASAPESVFGGWLINLTTTNLDVRVSYHHSPRDPTTIRGALQDRLTELQIALSRKEEKGATDYHEDLNRREELDRLLRRLTEGTTRLYDIGIYIEVAGSTRDELEETARKVQQLVADRDVELVPLEFRQLESQDAIAPVVSDPIQNTDLMEHDAAATLFGFVEPAIAHEDGVLYGFDETGNPVIVDRYSLSGFSKVITGKIGSGKTFAAKLSLWRRLLIDPEFTAIAFDPTGDDFVDFFETLGGDVVTFGGDVTINPLEIHRGTGEAEDPYKDKLRSLTGMVRTFYDQSGDSLSAERAGLIQQVFHLAYLMYGITSEPRTHERENPTMEDVLDILKALADGEDPLEFVSYQGDATELHREERDELDERVDEVTSRLQSKDDSNLKSEANSLLRSLEAFQPGGVAANLSGKTTVDLEDERLIVFDMSAFQDTNQAPLLQHVMLDWSYQRARENSRRMEVIFEEVHYLLSQKSARSLIGLFTRHSRHFNAGLTLISQTAEEFMQETDDVHSPRAIYDQCDIKQLFYQESISDEVIDYYDLSPADVEAIQSFARGQESEFSECLLSVTGIARRHLEIHASELTVDLLTEPETAAATAQLVEQRRQQAATARSEQTTTQPEESTETAGGLGEEGAEKETTDSSTTPSETSEPPTDPITDGSGGSPSSGDTADDTNSE
ncbi:VirB4 family type IV secretion system protein [Halopenitus sp. H-Gu1]|uniref:VirB4 family type IV secretion system protein n=1 Tax=Halopenitus sp. H-Gu1 TaxID=3242697 RepID=UPI00359DCE07